MSTPVALFLLCVCIASDVMANVEVCSLKSDTGPCDGLFPRWYHVNGVCKEFVYGGCKGNRNNFKMREECERKCIVCNLPAVSGNCEAYMPSWYFVNGVCKEFVYGGCGGNGNRFKSLNACKSACTIKQH
ncbi:actinia tenebrosa protease inhibitors-like [Dreissena polymorpha]|uniref:BPTI/Kunitz inhibitor domain-containing protein n=1 Tax=Dreissena polymorpha TaxID=45954 RepID=A0A9D4QRB7_DREPO|nr:actinia tenebrosa protease inhibitors-like [Dreissena polymorpha]KAH3840328.1 hypothetical protein DPMN_113775 [Dreissena polymorpha]